MVREVEDGADTVAWLREQPWFGGRFATMGPSYLGFTQWALLMDPPPELATAIVIVGPHDFSRVAWGTGAFALSDFLGWTEMMAHQEDAGRVRGLIRQATADKRVAPALAGLPALDAGEALLAGRAGWYRDWITHSDPSDPFWERMRLPEAVERVEVPVLLFTGWQDLFLGQTLEQYATLRERGVDVALTAGPWTHLDMVFKGAGTVARESAEWLAEHLAGTARRRRAPVRIFVTGAGEWRDLPAWPPPAGKLTLYLQPDGALGAEPPAADAPASVVHVRPGRPHADDRRARHVGHGRLPGRQRLGGALRRADLHRAGAHGGRRDRRRPGRRARPSQRQPARRRVRPTGRGRRRRPLAQRQRRARAPRARGRAGAAGAGRDRAPVRRRPPHPPAGGRRLASTLRAQSGHRRAVRHRRRGCSPRAARSPTPDRR